MLLASLFPGLWDELYSWSPTPAFFHWERVMLPCSFEMRLGTSFTKASNKQNQCGHFHAEALNHFVFHPIFSPLLWSLVCSGRDCKVWSEHRAMLQSRPQPIHNWHKISEPFLLQGTEIVGCFDTRAQATHVSELI